MKNLTEQPTWKALSQHYQTLATHHMRDWFAAEHDRFNRFSIQCDEILLDYSRNRITNETRQLLVNLATEQGLKAKIDALFTGQALNTTEQRSASHTALRNQPHASRAKLYQLAADIHSGKRVGITGKPFTHIINIGIGGSYLGPKMCTEALKDYAVSPLTFDFMSTVDPDHVRDVLADADPETTLFILSSKSFTTLETLTNGEAAKNWLTSKLGNAAWEQHTVAITACMESAVALGIAKHNIYAISLTVGGRFSIWSAIGLPLLLLLGSDQFDDFLDGAHTIDHHFQTAPFEQNIPVILALLSIWYGNFFDVRTQAITPYSYRLRSFVAYIQQLEMESNGKSVKHNGDRVDYATCPVIFGAEGCNSQHSFYQLLHQGRHLVPVDSIVIANPHDSSTSTHHDIVLASALSQAYAFMHGKTDKTGASELQAKGIAPSSIPLLAKHLEITGNKPNNLILLNRLSPKNLGALIAIYEHKVFTQSVIWDINAFDQWGVELGKQNLPSILQEIQHADHQLFSDTSTTSLIAYLKQCESKHE